MDVRSCKGCGRLYNYMGGAPLCQACQKELEEKFQDVKEYLDENPNASVSQVSEDMEVSVKQIKQWIRDERLTLSEATETGIACEHCGTPIRTGRFCDKCKMEIHNTFASALDKPRTPEAKKQERDGNRMRFLQ